ncbi:hypothetical protein [Streptomyces sp. NPDC001037]|uniref:hypothetical protein n=1 Tax=Streptomyces sp. NPDC001037 TaxID=3364542 RepID=UPI0036B38DA5
MAIQQGKYHPFSPSESLKARQHSTIWGMAGFILFLASITAVATAIFISRSTHRVHAEIALQQSAPYARMAAAKSTSGDTGSINEFLSFFTGAGLT